MRLAEFKFEVKYKKVANNHHADALSRLLTAAPIVDHEDDDYIPSFLINTDTPTGDGMLTANVGIHKEAFNAEE